MATSEGTSDRLAPGRVDPEAARLALAGLSESVAASDFGAAERHARTLLALVPADPSLRRILAAAELAQGKRSPALVNLRRALLASPDYTDALADFTAVMAEIGESAQAVFHYRHLLHAAPDEPRALAGLANLLRDSGLLGEAMIYYGKALTVSPHSPQLLANAALALVRLGEDPVLDALEAARPVVIACLESRDVESNSLNLVSQALMRADLEDWLSRGGEPMQPADLEAMLRRGGRLIAAHLMDSVVTDPDLENLFVRARACLLLSRTADGAVDDVFRDFIRALAHQGGLNEYLWAQSAEEKRRADALQDAIAAAIERGEEVVPADLYLLAAYRPLLGVEPLRRWATGAGGSIGSPLAEDLDILVLDRVREAALEHEIPDLTSIKDITSNAVRDQYEDNPYPRWNALARFEPVDPLRQIAVEIAPNAPAFDPLPAHPRVLIAGCGTGRQVAQAAMTYAGASILAVDLSRPSLAFAKRMSERLGLGAIRFARADILALPAIPERFDIIECSGVLHHMADPDAGLKALLSVLAPGGLMKIALYSAAARTNVTRLRTWIAEHGFPANLEGIRGFRAALPASGHPDAEATRRSIDYNATSAIRDLLFHAQEHQFTVPGLERLLVANGLEFLGFLFLDTGIKRRFLERFPEDTTCLDLSNWADFETENPLTFLSMYQFWCRRHR